MTKSDGETGKREDGDTSAPRSETGDLELHARRIEKADGRYLIFFTFSSDGEKENV